ncbi:SdpI family protein [Sphingobacterium corticis]|uniref:SdpI family protein n=1 Tax=Sphingobacterium corticis TaxID=1812823 RepID=A0ABW5NFG5_9SPHI
MPEEYVEIILIDLLLLIVSFALYFFPAKKINFIYGYRTTRSMRNQINWQLSQRYFAKQWIWVVPTVMLIQLALIFLTDFDFGKNNRNLLHISMAIYFVGSIVCMFRTERKLKQNID